MKEKTKGILVLTITCLICSGLLYLVVTITR